MDKLATELRRLYGIGAGAADAANATATAAGAVLEVVLPAGWDALSAAWQGVQADLGLPAPAIAVSGTDALQLWFGFSAPVAPGAPARLLDALRERYLAALAPKRVRAFADPLARPAPPFAETAPQRWSAFVTPDLAAVFADTPWLDIPPSDEGQATILRALAPISAGAWQEAAARLGAPSPAPAVAAPIPGELPASDPARFLAEVMNNDRLPLAQRIEAARILLLAGRAA